MPQAHNSWPTGSHNASRRGCGTSRASCWERQRRLGLVTLPSRRGLPSCSGAVSPASQHAPRHPKHGHSPTPAAPAPALREPLHARALRLRLGRLGKPASEHASEGREAFRARARSDGPFLAIGGKRDSENRAGCTAQAGGVSAAHGPAGLGTVRRPKGEEASRIARACAVQRTRLINRGMPRCVWGGEREREREGA